MKTLIGFLLIAICIIASITAAAVTREKRGLDPDNKSHRGFSDRIDQRFNGNRAYENFARPVIHGTYHAGRYAFNGRNPEEWARSKDQFSKFGTGQQRTDYLKAHRNGR